MNKIIPYGRQEITDEDINAVVKVLKSDYLTQGPEIKKFENLFAEYVGSKYAIAVSNGTAALHLCVKALGFKNGKNVITSPNTFVASANCIKYNGGNVIFSDIDEKTFLIDLNKIENLLSKSINKISGIIPVNFAGYPVDLEKLRKIADKYNLWIVEDACHSPGGYFIDSNKKNQKCGNGNYADLSIFSFHPVKHIACGEGGMITTNNKKLRDKILNLRTHGIQQNKKKLKRNDGLWYYEMHELGYNYRLTDIQSSLGISQLSRAKIGIQKRIKIVNKYEEFFSDKSYIISKPGLVNGHAYHLYVIQIENRNALHAFLRKNNIYCQIHYIPCHTMPYYQDLGYSYGDFPNSEKYYERCLSLPIYPSLSNDEQDFVLNKINEFFS
tara:strand:+ start:5088 stop:6239 length:1152 start_codon:yes stop_codon:yes gene_type:complete